MSDRRTSTKIIISNSTNTTCHNCTIYITYRTHSCTCTYPCLTCTYKNTSSIRVRPFSTMYTHCMYIVYELHHESIARAGPASRCCTSARACPLLCHVFVNLCRLTLSCVPFSLMCSCLSRCMLVCPSLPLTPFLCMSRSLLPLSLRPVRTRVQSVLGGCLPCARA